MSRGDWLRPLSVVGVFSFALGGAAHAVQRPNLLFIMTDQQRWDALSIAGNEVLETPNLDRIGTDDPDRIPNVKRVTLFRNPEMTRSGMQDQTFDERPYKTNPLDTRHGLEPGIKVDENGEKLRVLQQSSEDSGVRLLRKNHLWYGAPAKKDSPSFPVPAATVPPEPWRGRRLKLKWPPCTVMAAC